MILKDKHIILGITGSIAAYKAAYIIRGLVKKGAEVQVVITPAGKEFITPLTLSTLSSHPVISEFFSNRDGTWNSHVDLGLWADAMLIAPATASTIGKMANGIADNMLITTYLSCKAPVFVAPAMDLDMFAHASMRVDCPDKVLRSIHKHGLLARFEITDQKTKPDKLPVILIPCCSLRLLRKPVFKFRRIFCHFQHAEDCDVLPDAVEIIVITIFEDRRYLTRLQVDRDKAALLRDSCQLYALRQFIGLSVRNNICFSKGYAAQHTSACLILVFRLPACEGAGRRTADA